MRPRAALALLLAACASQPPTAPGPAQAPPAPVPADSPAPPPEPVPEASSNPTPRPVPTASPAPPPADPPALDLLGKPRPAIEARLGAPRGEQDGWTRYADIDLQYRRGKCVRLRRTAPASLDCADVPIWAGIINPVGFPLRRATTCEWPGLSERHKLADGLAATHDHTTHQFEVWLRD
jgi:hypothetical protein